MYSRKYEYDVRVRVFIIRRMKNVEKRANLTRKMRQKEDTRKNASKLGMKKEGGRA